MPVYNAPTASLSTLTPQQQENLILMADTDVRSILQSLETVVALQATQAASITLASAGLTGLKAITVIEKVKQLDRANFVFAAGFWNINVLHELQNQYPITAIFDASGDEQFIQFVGKDVNNGTVELTQSQYDSNSFPLKIVLHGRVGDIASTPIPNTWKLFSGNNTYYRLINFFIESSIDGINILATSTERADSAYMAPGFNYIVTETRSGGYVNFTLSLVQPYSGSGEEVFNQVRQAPGSFQL